MPITQKNFNKILHQFTIIEDMRDELWDRCIRLLKDGYEIEAYILLLATWDFAYFRFTMKNIKISKFKKILEKINPIFDELKNKKFTTADLNEPDLRKSIRFIYKKLKDYDAIKQTGATKIMALKNPKLFVMWDTEIRKIYKINNRASSDDYLRFLIEMKKRFGHLKPPNKKTPLAKAIDEYNYVIAEKRRTKIKNVNYPAKKFKRLWKGKF